MDFWANRSVFWPQSTAGASGQSRRRPSSCSSRNWWSTGTARRTPGNWPSRCRTGRASRLCELARRHRLVLSVGLSEKERDIVYNTQVLVGPEGYIGKQRKLHLSRDEVNYYKGGREILVFDIGRCKVGTVICYDNQFPEIARVLALRGADVILMPHAARFKPWDDTPEGEAAARRHSHYFVAVYALRARENACFAVLTDQAGRAGTLDSYPKDHDNQPHHAGVAMIWGRTVSSWRRATGAGRRRR